MVYLQALSRILERQDPMRTRFRVMDQGPVYSLTKLCELGLEPLTTERLARWWEESLDRWASLLDVIIWLDAPDQVLIERINIRGKRHLLKGARDRDARDVLAQSRARYEYVISRLSTRRQAPEVLRYDTGRQALDEVVNTVISALT
jgi:hypothetical protein